jgi:hypothetical protein
MDWQQAAALAIVATSFLWLLRRTFFGRGKKGGCGGCGTCSHAAPSAPPAQLVQLDLSRPEALEQSHLSTDPASHG